MDPDPITILRAACAAAGSQAAWARSVDISPQHVADLLSGRRAFSDAMLARLGLRRVERIEWVEGWAAPPARCPGLPLG